jgi:hypothetical protein
VKCNKCGKISEKTENSDRQAGRECFILKKGILSDTGRVNEFLFYTAWGNRLECKKENTGKDRCPVE